MGGEVVTHAAAGRLQGVEEAGISEVYKGQRTTASPHSIYVTSKKKKKNGPFEKITPTSGETLEPHQRRNPRTTRDLSADSDVCTASVAGSRQ